VKTITLGTGIPTVTAAYTETVAGDLYVRMGFSPNPQDLAFHGHANLTASFDGPSNSYSLVNAGGGGVELDLGAAVFNAAPADAGYLRRNQALTEQVEFHADGSFTVVMSLLGTGGGASGVPGDRAWSPLPMAGPYPSPSRGRSVLRLSLAEAVSVNVDVVDIRGRRVHRQDLGRQPAGEVEIPVDLRVAEQDLPSGVYFLRVQAGEAQAVRKWVVMR
jgi:hypothetical protein